MVEPIRKNQAVGPCQRRKNRHIGLVTRVENKGGFGLLQFRQSLFNGIKKGKGPADQAGSRCPCSEPLGKRETGAKAALPIWIRFMREALATEPEVDFDVPPGIVFVSTDAESGELASERCPSVLMEAFIEGTQPTEMCRLHDPTARDFMSLDLGLPEDGLAALDGTGAEGTDGKPGAEAPPFSSD